MKPKKVKPPALVAHPHLVALRIDIEATRKAASEAQDRWEVEATRLVNSKLQTAHEELYFGGYDCPESPTVHCVYDEVEDHMHDYCLFCEDPEERN